MIYKLGFDQSYNTFTSTLLPDEDKLCIKFLSTRQAVGSAGLSEEGLRADFAARLLAGTDQAAAREADLCRSATPFGRVFFIHTRAE
jgi:hypothetical protein